MNTISTIFRFFLSCHLIPSFFSPWKHDLLGHGCDYLNIIKQCKTFHQPLSNPKLYSWLRKWKRFSVHRKSNFVMFLLANGWNTNKHLKKTELNEWTNGWGGFFESFFCCRVNMGKLAQLKANCIKRQFNILVHAAGNWHAKRRNLWCKKQLAYAALAPVRQSPA